MFPKCTTVLTFEADTDLSQLEEQLAAHRFLPCTDLQVSTHGWSAVTEEGTLVHTAMGFKLLRFTLETKTIPGSAFKVLLAARVAEREKQCGHKVGRKLKKELAEDLKDELLPRQLAARKDVMVMIDPVKHRLLVDSATSGVVEEVIRSFIKHAEIALSSALGFGRKLTIVASEGLTTDLEDFQLTDQASVAWMGDTKSAISWKKSNLFGSTLNMAISADAHVTSIGLNNDKLSFVLTSDGYIKGIRPLDTVKEEVRNAADFDAGVVLAGLEMRQLIDQLTNLQKELTV